MEEDLERLGGLLRASDSEEDEEEEQKAPPPRVAKWLAPGGSKAAGSAVVAEKDKKGKGVDLRQLLGEGLAAGKNAADLMPVMMMAMPLKQDEKEKKSGKKQKGGAGNLLGGFDRRGP